MNFLTKNRRLLCKSLRLHHTLVIAEHDDATLKPITTHSITAAKQITGDITVLLAGTKCGGAAEALSKASGVTKLLISENAAYKGFLPETFAGLVVALQTANNFTHIVAGASSFTKSLLPRIAAKLDVAAVSEITAIKAPDTFQRAIYAGNATQTVTSSDKVKVLLIRGTSFAGDALTGGAVAPTPHPDAPPANALSEFVSENKATSSRPELTTAKIVVSGGRGLGSKDNFKMVYDLADKLKAGVGASRAAVDAGYVGNDLQIGQTGQIIAADLYIALGISGAIQHLAGVKDCKTIVAINKDGEAPIFQVANFGLVADLFKAIPELMQKL